MSKQIIFYDIPSVLKYKAWSPNTWKVRYVLNFKKLPYKTVWVEYPDIAQLCKDIGAEPSSVGPGGKQNYTLPVIQDPNTNTVVSESYRIAEYLEKTYPDSPKLFPTGSEGLQAAFHDLYESTKGAAFPKLMLGKVVGILQPASQPYFRRTREAAFGKKMEELHDDAEEQWAKWREAHSKIAAWYDKNGGGHFIQGNGPTYADINVAAFFAWSKFLSNGESEQWKNMLTWDNGKWAKLVEALEPYETVDA